MKQNKQVEKITPRTYRGDIVLEGKFEKGDMIYIHNKEGCRIATYEVV